MTLDFEITDKRYNSLLERTEVHFEFIHAKEPTPTRDLARDKVAELVNVKKETVVIDRMRSDFGRGTTHGYAKVYKTKADAQKNERTHHLKRNHILDEKKAKNKKKTAEKKTTAEKKE